jgi:hypothetical protein
MVTEANRGVNGTWPGIHPRGADFIGVSYRRETAHSDPADVANVGAEIGALNYGGVDHRCRGAGDMSGWGHGQ